MDRWVRLGPLGAMGRWCFISFQIKSADDIHTLALFYVLSAPQPDGRLIAFSTNVVGRTKGERRRKKDHLGWSGTSSIQSDVEVIYLPKLFALLLIHIH
jgi:hypothetical protein